MIFDREGYGAEFFNNLIENDISFVTWEKHTDSKKLNEIAEEKFTESFEMNGKKYKIFEGEKTFKFRPRNNKTKLFGDCKILHCFSVAIMIYWTKNIKFQNL
jgi:hypothetical protein